MKNMRDMNKMMSDILIFLIKLIAIIICLMFVAYFLMVFFKALFVTLM